MGRFQLWGRAGAVQSDGMWSSDDDPRGRGISQVADWQPAAIRRHHPNHDPPWMFRNNSQNSNRCPTLAAASSRSSISRIVSTSTRSPGARHHRGVVRSVHGRARRRVRIRRDDRTHRSRPVGNLGIGRVTQPSSSAEDAPSEVVRYGFGSGLPLRDIRRLDTAKTGCADSRYA